MSRGLHKWPVTSTGSVIGFASPVAGDCPVHYHGYQFSNSAASVGAVTFYEPVAAPGAGGNKPLVPSAAGTLVFTIQIPANSSKEFVFDGGVLNKDGLFAVTSAATLTGVVIYS